MKEYIQLFIAFMGVSGTVLMLIITIVLITDGCGSEQKDVDDLKTGAAVHSTSARLSHE